MCSIVNVDDIEDQARNILAKSTFDYVNSGASDEITLINNKCSFTRYQLLPRVLKDVSHVDLHTTILGHRVDIPLGVAPTSFNKVVHPDGELASVAAAADMKTIYTISSNASYTMEDIVKEAPRCVIFLQLYFPQDKPRDVIRDMVHRAEVCGVKALVLTVDAPVMANRYKQQRNNFVLPHNVLPEHLNKSFINTGARPVDHTEHSRSQAIPSTWDDFYWLKSITKLPIILKGVMAAADARLGVENGAAAIWISNHGGRQLDTVPATIDVLPSIVSAVGGRCEVYLDGGIRRGTDILKALALGARAVFIGSPILNGLAYNGKDGAQQVLQILKDELATSMALVGSSSISDLTTEMVIHESKLQSKL